MTRGKSIATLLITVLLIAVTGFIAIFGVGDLKTGAAENIILGLDLKGGVSITYQTKEENPSEKDMEDTVYKLQKRAEIYSTEAEVYQEGDRRITIEIPGATDADAVLDELGKPGSLEFVASNSDGSAGGVTVLTGKDIKNAEAGTQESQTGAKEYVVQLTLTDEGAQTFGEVTAANIGKQIAIMYDERQISNPTVNSAIRDGRPVITGMASYEEAEELATMIRIGGISLELEELRSNVVGAKLGEEALSSSLKAGLIGLLIVMVFMVVIFLIPGVVASIALILYTTIMLLVLNAFDITLTLPGIAGIILSIGMAVDANVIIFTRIKEEIGNGSSVRTAIKAGFSKALSAIIDGNVTTLIAALVLGIMGTGSVKGFAITLAIGIVLSMFTALVITRFILQAFFTLGVQNEKFYGSKKDGRVINFLGKKLVFFIIAIVAIGAGFVAMGIQAAQGNQMLNLSLEFMGGTTTTVPFNEDYSIEQIDEKVKPVFGEVTGDNNIQAQKVASENEADKNKVIIKTRRLSEDEREALNNKLVEEFGVVKNDIESDSISSTVSGEMRRDAIVSVIIAVILMLIYIWFRFKDIRFASGAVIALLHDVLVVLTCYAVVRISVGNTFIACMLTIVGYSINATIVIFDRIRENMGGSRNKKNLDEIVNKSITQTLTRSIYTSFTTFIMVFLLWIMGVASVREFAAPLMVGIIAGGFSSVCISGTVWYLMKKGKGSKKEEAGESSEA
ncbi:MAG: protein translocase subunit SecD [Lachnospiraceae bacterium]|nr:protein translocase subunit SecD [Lachnospiraceae bacterium]